MVIIRKDAPKLNPDESFWHALMLSEDINVKDFIKGQVYVNSIEQAIRTLRSFEKDLQKAGVFDEV